MRQPGQISGTLDVKTVDLRSEDFRVQTASGTFILAESH